MRQIDLQAMYATIDAARWSDLRQFFHPQMVYLRPGYTPLEGIDAVLHFYEHVRVIGEGVHTVTLAVAEGSHQAAFGRFVGRSRDGRPLDEEFADSFVIQDGLILRRQSYFFRPAV